MTRYQLTTHHIIRQSPSLYSSAYHDLWQNIGNAVQCHAWQTSCSATAKIAQVGGYYAVQGDSRSLNLVRDFPLVNNTNLLTLCYLAPFSSYRTVLVKLSLLTGGASL